MRRAASVIVGFLTGALRAVGFVCLVLLVRHPLARYALHEAFQQDVSTFRRWTFGE